MQYSASGSRSGRLVLLSCALAVVLVATVALASCGQSAPALLGADVGPTVPPTIRGDVKPTHPPTPAGTATPTVTPNITPASTVGWQTYTDSTYHFKTVIPPGWRIGTTLDNTIPNLAGPCEYEVIYFPPGDTHTADPYVWMRINEVMVIFVNLYCYPPDDTPNHLPSSTVTVTISGVSTKLYSEDTSDGVKRVVFAHFGGHVYGFYVLGPTADGPLYMGVLSGFAYLGAQ